MADWPRSLNFIVPPHSESFGLGRHLSPGDYLERLTEYIGAAERIGVGGAFVYDFPVAMDPWLAAYDVLVSSKALEPIVAVRPAQESAESVARRAVDLTYRFGRPAHVNVVAGATRPSRTAADLEDRQAARRRMADFAAEVRAGIDRRLGGAGQSGAGQMRAPLVFTPASSAPGVVPADCVLLMARPREMLGREVARVRAEQGVERVAMLVGLVVRDGDEAAWEAAAALHPHDRRQEVAGQLFRSQVVSSEHLTSYALTDAGELHDGLLWYGAPARGIDAPKLVGGHDRVRSWLEDCREMGVTELILDLVPDPAEYAHMEKIFTGRQSPPERSD